MRGLKHQTFCIMQSFKLLQNVVELKHYCFNTSRRYFVRDERTLLHLGVLVHFL